MDKKVTTAGSLKVGNYVIIDNIACIVKRIDTSRPGKHGHAKCRIESTGIIDKQKRIQVYPAHDKVEIPIITKKNAQVLSLMEDLATVMDSESYETFDLKVPEELKGKVKEGNEIVYWVILNDKIMKQVK